MISQHRSCFCRWHLEIYVLDVTGLLSITICLNRYFARWLTVHVEQVPDLVVGEGLALARLPRQVTLVGCPAKSMEEQR